MRKTLLSLSVLIIALYASTASAEIIDRIAAIVNDDIITSYEVSNEKAAIMKQAEKQGTATPEFSEQVDKTLLDQMIDRKLVQQRVKELKIDVSDEELQQTIDDIKKQNNNMSQEAFVEALKAQGLTLDEYKDQLREQMERARVLNQDVKEKAQVNDQEIRDYYDKNKDAFREPEQFRARNIFFKIPENASNDQIKSIMAKAMSVREMALKGDSFEDLAKKYSDDPNAAKDGGDLGTFKKGDMVPEIENSVITMKPGQISDLISTASGIHIIKLEEIIPGKEQPFETVKSNIGDLLSKKKVDERFKEWNAELRKNAVIDIKPA
ncbi:MAG: peptidylprolyl isomerase [Desulfuromonadales bacterium]|nr:peptidylprolyl isomerase [Desulfuromonadales bacterium]